MKKKILIYIDSLNSPGGIERIVYELIQAWKSKYEINIITKDEPSCFYGDINDLNVISIGSPRVINMKNRVQRVFSTLRNSVISVIKIKKIDLSKIDYIYVATPLNALEMILAGGDCKKIVVSEHGSAYGVNKIYSAIKKYTYPKVKCVSVPNRMDVDYYKKLGSNALYIPHLVYLKGKEINKLDSKIILNCGRLTADKRQIELLKIWKNIQNKNGWKLYIVGDGEEKNALSEYVVDNDMISDVELLSARKDIESIYKKTSLFAFTSRFEGFGLVLMEAMSFGIPCISFDCPSGPRDIVINGKNGYLIENNNGAQFTKKLETLINLDVDELKEFGTNAYELVNNWDNNTILNKWDEIFTG